MTTKRNSGLRRSRCKESEAENARNLKKQKEAAYSIFRGLDLICDAAERGALLLPPVEPAGRGRDDGEDFSSAAASLCTDASQCSVEVESDPNRGLVRVRKLPARLGDSIVGARKNEKQKADVPDVGFDSGGAAGGLEAEKFSFKKQKLDDGSVRDQPGKGKRICKAPNLASLLETEEDDKGSKKNPTCRSSLTCTEDQLGNGKHSCKTPNSIPLMETGGEDKGSKKNSISRCSLTYSRKRPLDVHAKPRPARGVEGSQVEVERAAEKKKDFYRPEDFVLGDIVWAKSGKRFPAWPAIVIDPILQAPETVLNSCVAGATCVMFFGHSRNGAERGQTQLHKSKPSDFRMAIEEAFLAEHDFVVAEPEEMTKAAEPASRQSDHGDMQEATGSNQYQECQSQTQASWHCGLAVQVKNTKKMKSSVTAGQLLCKHCTKDMENMEYFCPDCKAKFNFDLSDTEKSQPHVQCTPVGNVHSMLVLELFAVVVLVGQREGHFVAGSDTQVLKHNAQGLVSTSLNNNSSLKMRKEKLLDFLQGSPSYILSTKNAMEQEASAISLLGFAEHVKHRMSNGRGALKTSDVENLWIHVTCAWFQPEVSFLNDEKMEPAVGILNIPSSSFVKTHGSCTRCCKCSTYYHAMCASRAGYRMELGFPCCHLKKMFNKIQLPYGKETHNVYGIGHT
ncbi:hypothetical protein ACLOJK_009945 [Asimina triloba]